MIKKNEVDGACGARGDRRGAYRILVGNLKERNHLEDRGLDGRIILKWVFKEWGGEAWTELICLRIGTSGGSSRMR
jgi:hypothetical protein